MNDFLSLEPVNWYQVFVTSSLVYKIIKIFLMVVAAFAGPKIIAAFTKRLQRRIKKSASETLAQKRQRIKTITSLIVNASSVVINLAVFLLILTELGVNVFPLLTGVGILGLGIGMGARTLVADLIAGFFILLENQFNVGDWIKIGGTAGKVIKISLRTITLKGKKGNIYIIPNSSIKIVEKLEEKI